MSDSRSGLSVLLAELKRRRVYRVAVVYAVVAFVIWQAAEIAFPALNLPEWTLTFVVVATLLGFPIAMVLAWAFDITPQGVKRAESLTGERETKAAATAGVAQLDTLLSIPSEVSVPLLRIDPAWDPLRDDPRFQALFTR